MIITLTPNPSLDRTLAVTELGIGEVNRATSSRIDPGGKGVNVARALTKNGCPTKAVLPLGGPTGDLMKALITQSGVSYVATKLFEETRTNTAIVDGSGHTTKVNEPGPAPTEEELAELKDVVLTASREADWLAFCGSLPRETPSSFYADLVAKSKCPVAVDTSGAALKDVISAGPALIKPNDEELAELCGRELHTYRDVIEAGREVCAEGVGLVVASLGAHGALAISRENWWFAAAKPITPVSTVAAGDSLLAGTLKALFEGADVGVALAKGVAFGAAAVGLPGSQVPGAGDVARIEVRTDAPDLDQKLNI